jgi:hypothetical protein
MFGGSRNAKKPAALAARPALSGVAGRARAKIARAA